ncbi:hypothetical protein [Ktedonospora formicarum]|uniref:Uncharacterized protein n=1 Tax=Ktedonospora formicarum TaxID=2778364 RepID=A0A8J3MXF5_9CHLR|nr:hypothetical protein [Ktedonospora formicarum]GHO49693.1 hypothetical protein KSX_78560 [Ktedonospora formicarum]
MWATASIASGIDPYTGNEEENFQLFSSRIGKIKGEHLSQELSFWKTKDTSTSEVETPSTPPIQVAEKASAGESQQKKEAPEETKEDEKPSSED